MSIFHVTQTLINLNLAWNNISNNGVQYLANTLQNNTERHGFFVHLRHHSTQSLMMLNLAGNEITDQGVQYLAQALQKNKVK
jgi:Ran GTPase-activating protein (RanGAP) involved in mRNA processing and transport